MATPQLKRTTPPTTRSTRSRTSPTRRRRPAPVAESPTEAFTALETDVASLQTFVERHGDALAARVLYSIGALNLFGDGDDGPNVEQIVMELEGGESLATVFRAVQELASGRPIQKAHVEQLERFTSAALNDRFMSAYLLGLAVGRRLAGAGR